MSAHLSAPPGYGAPTAPAYPRPTGVALVRRRHVDLMRVCSDGCRRSSAQ